MKHRYTDNAPPVSAILKHDAQMLKYQHGGKLLTFQPRDILF